MSLRMKCFENIVGKGENAEQAFSPFSKCFLPFSHKLHFVKRIYVLSTIAWDKKKNHFFINNPKFSADTLKMGFFVPIFQLVTTRAEPVLAPAGDHINKLGRGLQGDAIY